MNYKGIIIDLDDTLYNYKKAHDVALKEVILFAKRTLSINEEKIKEGFNKARKKTHIDLSGKASSHNRLLYFQKMLEELNINSMIYALDLYNQYWNEFLQNMFLYEGIEEFLEKIKILNIKVCILTDLTSHIQYRKIRKLKLEKYIDYIVTSEEAGVEKPHTHMFYKALDKMKLSKEDVIIIGDDYNKDIIGATNMEMKGIWINHKNIERDFDDNVIEIKDTKALKGMF